MISGGLSEEVDDKMIQAAFIPFGDILDVNIPIDYETSKHRGFAFLEYELPEDAAAAIDNMNESELCGRTIRVNIAKPMKNKEGASRALWNSDEWLQEHAATEGVDKENKEGSGESKKENDASDDVIFISFLSRLFHHISQKFERFLSQKIYWCKISKKLCSMTFLKVYLHCSFSRRQVSHQLKRNVQILNVILTLV